jgi:hypothetical protein
MRRNALWLLRPTIAASAGTEDERRRETRSPSRAQQGDAALPRMVTACHAAQCPLLIAPHDADLSGFQVQMSPNASGRPTLLQRSESSVRCLSVVGVRDLGRLCATPADRILFDFAPRPRRWQDRCERLLIAPVEVNVALREGYRDVFLVEAQLDRPGDVPARRAIRRSRIAPNDVVIPCGAMPFGYCALRCWKKGLAELRDVCSRKIGSEFERSAAALNGTTGVGRNKATPHCAE